MCAFIHNVHIHTVIHECIFVLKKKASYLPLELDEGAPEVDLEEGPEGGLPEHHLELPVPVFVLVGFVVGGSASGFVGGWSTHTAVPSFCVYMHTHIHTHICIYI